ncbi:valine--tRNA ligase, mitochondrial-like [Amblyraja radiata]|uniref:valine--tRNA ligase, mitochondrial-like n=1 Tax=Amblyraja radiata TaxID=386614 RepID=UPI0014034F6F|nr:valine--tRNA ligase, mitochondrial-like [Amblyraja radiata]
MGVQVLLLCVEGGLRLLAPLMPFLTEELWQRLPPTPHKLYPSISIAPYPSLTHTPDWSSQEVELDFELVQEVVRAVRGVRAEYRLTREKPHMFVSGPPEISTRLQPFLGPLQTLSRAGGVELLPPGEGPPPGTVQAVVTHTCRVHLMLQGGVDTQTERARLADQRRRLEAELATAEGRSRGDGFTEKVPEKVRSKQNNKMSRLRAQLEWISEAERGLGEPGDRS